MQSRWYQLCARVILRNAIFMKYSKRQQVCTVDNQHLGTFELHSDFKQCRFLCVALVLVRKLRRTGFITGLPSARCDADGCVWWCQRQSKKEHGSTRRDVQVDFAGRETYSSHNLQNKIDNISHCT